MRVMKGRPAVVAYREHNGEPFHYMVTSYDKRGRVEAFLRYRENLGYDANGRMNKMWTLLGANGTGVGTGTPSYPTPLTKPHQEDMQYTYDQMGRVEQMRYLPEDVLMGWRRYFITSCHRTRANGTGATGTVRRVNESRSGCTTLHMGTRVGRPTRGRIICWERATNS